MSRGRRGVGPVEIQIACGSTSKIYNGFFFSVTDAIEMVNVEASARVALSLWVKILFSNNQGFANSRSIAGARIVCEILIYLIALKNLRHGMLTVVQESSVAEKPLPNASLCMAVRHASRRKSASSQWDRFLSSVTGHWEFGYSPPSAKVVCYRYFECLQLLYHVGTGLRTSQL